MKKKILMVYPEIPTTYWSFKYTQPFTGCKSSMPPLGLLTVAALLPENYDIRLIDMHVNKLTIKDIKDSDLIFLSAMIVQKESFNKVIMMCNECGKPVVAGGPYPTSSYKEIEGVDYFVLNEAEVTLPEFLRDYENGNPRKIYTSEVKPDITLIPPPRYDLIGNVRDYTYLALQYSRGCPFNCEFCDIIEMLGRNHRSKTPEQFINEMQHVYETGYRGTLFIVDDNFIGNRKKVKTLLRSILEWQKGHDYPFILLTEASVNLAQDDELLELMFRSGFSSVFIGIETPDAATLSHTQKSQNLRDDLLTSLKKIQSSGLEIMGGFIVGFDTDPEDIFDRQIDFIQKAGIPTAMFGILQALPNTQLQRRLESEGRLLRTSSGNNTHDMELNFIPKMDKDKLISGYKKVISEIYRPKAYFKRTMILLNRLPDNRKGEKKISIKDIKPLLLSLFKQTFSSYGYIYLKFLFSILLRKPALFPLAVNLAVKGYHFFKITEELTKVEEFSSVFDAYMQMLHDKVKNIDLKNNIPGIISVIERYRFLLKKKTIKKYRQMNYNLHHILEEKLAKIDEYCDMMISGYKKKLLLSDN